MSKVGVMKLAAPLVQLAVSKVGIADIGTGDSFSEFGLSLLARPRLVPDKLL